MTKITLVLVCPVVGPDLYDHDSEVTIDTPCSKPQKHEGRHVWWNDEGDVRVEWDGEGPAFNYGSGSWREEFVDE